MRQHTKTAIGDMENAYTNAAGRTLTEATVNGRLLAQTAVTLDADAVTESAM